MAKFIKTEKDYRIYELDQKECKQFNRLFPTLVCWRYSEDVGNMLLAENETETLDEMIEWCNRY